VIIIYNASIPGVLREIMRSPNTGLMNIMACRVFRNTKFDVFREVQISTTIVLTELPVAIPLSLREGERMKQSGDSTSNIDGIAITQEVERTHDCSAQ
jgi:hypothetical protein